MKSKWFWLIYLVFAFIVGFVFSYLVYLGYWYRFVDGIKSLSWYDYPLWFFLTFYITLIIHELSHLLAFVFQGVSIRALYLHMLIIYRSKTKWKIKFNMKHWFLLGGFVVPNLNEIDDDVSYQKTVKQFSTSLIVAPIVTISFMGLMILTWVLSILFDAQTSWVGFITLFSAYTTIFSLFYIRSFKLSNNSFYGDFVAYRKMKEDTLFQLVQLLQYIQFSLKTSALTRSYLFEQSKSFLKEHDVKTTLFYQILVMNYIEMVCYHEKEDDVIIQEKINRMHKNQLFRSDHGLTLLYDIALYQYHLGFVEKSYQLMEDIKTKASPKIDERLRTYLHKQFEHLLNIENHEEFLAKEENHVLSIASLFDVLMEDEEPRKPLPFKIWEIPVVFKEETEEKSDSE